MSSVALFRHTILALQRVGSRALAERLRAIDLTPAWAEVIDVLSAQGALSIRELGALLVCEADHPSKLVARMADAGLVTRRDHPDDGRAWKVHLTAKGQRAAQRLAAAEAALDKHILKQLSARELDAVLPVLLRVLGDSPVVRALAARYPEAIDRSARVS
jgi:DNA-binding MarR family transcriptional regulator